MDIIDGDKKKPHSKLCKDIEDQIQNKVIERYNLGKISLMYQEYFCLIFFDIYFSH